MRRLRGGRSCRRRRPPGSNEEEPERGRAGDAAGRSRPISAGSRLVRDEQHDQEGRGRTVVDVSATRRRRAGPRARSPATMPARTSPRPSNAADTPLLSTPPDLRPSDNHTAAFCSIRRHAVQQGLIPSGPIAYESPRDRNRRRRPEARCADRHRCARRRSAAARRRDRLPLVRAGLLPDLPHAAHPRRRRLGRRGHHADHARHRLREQAGRADAGGPRPDGQLDRDSRLHAGAVLRVRLRGRARREVGHRLEPLLDHLRASSAGRWRC